MVVDGLYNDLMVFLLSKSSHCNHCHDPNDVLDSDWKSAAWMRWISIGHVWSLAYR